MTILIAGLLLFFGVHTIPLFQGVRTAMITKFGETRFKGLYSLAALAGFIGILAGMKYAPYVPVWTPPGWSAQAANLLMPVAFCLFAAVYIPNNFRRVIRNPMLSATLVWSLAHLASNGDLASILLFGSFGAYAIIDIRSVNRRSEATAISRQPLWYDLATLAVGFVAFWFARHFHAEAFGVAVPY